MNDSLNSTEERPRGYLAEPQEPPYTGARELAQIHQRQIVFQNARGGSLMIAVPIPGQTPPVTYLVHFDHYPKIWKEACKKFGWIHLYGSVSHGTLRNEDLIPRFMGILEEHRPDRATMLTSEYSADGWPYSQAGLGWGDPFEGKQVELAPHLLEDLFTQLAELAPPGYYFGAHPGDGSDFGFWQLEEDELQTLYSDAEVLDENPFEIGEIKVHSFDQRAYDQAVTEELGLSPSQLAERFNTVPPSLEHPSLATIGVPADAAVQTDPTVSDTRLIAGRSMTLSPLSSLIAAAGTQIGSIVKETVNGLRELTHEESHRDLAIRWAGEVETYGEVRSQAGAIWEKYLESAILLAINKTLHLLAPRGESDD